MVEWCSNDTMVDIACSFSAAEPASKAEIQWLAKKRYCAPIVALVGSENLGATPIVPCVARKASTLSAKIKHV